MDDSSPTTPDTTEELLTLFWQRLGSTPAAGDALSGQRMDAARRVVLAVGPSAEAVLLVAEYADQFGRDLPLLADELEHPPVEVRQMAPNPPTGRALIAATAVRQGQAYQDGGNFAAAERAFRWAAEQFHAAGERAAESLPLVLLGRVVEMQERLDEAVRCYQEALTIDQAVGDQFNAAVDLGLLGQVAWLQGRLDDAEQLAHRALALHRREHDSLSTATTLMTLAEVAKLRGQRWRARLYVLRSRLARLGLA